MDPNLINDLISRLNQAFPPELRTLQEGFEQNFRAILTSTLAKLNLVTREEFDVQAQVLAKTRAKLELLEAQLQKFEEKMLSK